jgi:adenylate kinase
VPDDIILDLVRERLDRPDCRTNGWILEGCPINKYQIQQLKDLMIVPQVVIAFELSDEEVIDRLSKVKLDPVTGKIYQSEQDAEPSIRKRLVEKSENTLPQIEKRLNEYHEFLASAETDFN